MTSSFISIEEILTSLNSYGRFQRIINIIFAFITMPTCFHILIMYFIEAQPQWKCVVVGGDENSSGCGNGTIYPASNQTRCDIPRRYWAYAESNDYSIITEFQLDCGKEYLAYIANSVYFLGWAIGAIILGILSNLYGRRIVIVTSSFITLSIGLVSSFVPNIYLFICCRFILGIFTMGNVSLLIVLIGEFIDTKHRPLAGMIITVSYTVAITMLGVKAYFIRRWRLLLRACSLPYFFVIFFYKFIPESIRWLYLHNRKREMLAVCKRMAYWNKRKFPDDFTIPAPESTSQSRAAVSKIFGNRQNLKLIMVLMFNWFSANALYYAFFLTAEDFGISMYLTFIFFALVEVPSNIIGSVCSDRLGRKKTVPISILLGGAISFLIAFLPKTKELLILRIILGVFGTSFLIISFNFLIIWSVEILTTDIRSVGIGIVSAAGRFGGISAPWIAVYLRMIHPSLPFVTIGGVGVISGLAMLSLPETRGVVMKDEVHEKELDNV